MDDPFGLRHAIENHPAWSSMFKPLLGAVFECAPEKAALAADMFRDGLPQTLAADMELLPEDTTPEKLIAYTEDLLAERAAILGVPVPSLRPCICLDGGCALPPTNSWDVLDDDLKLLLSLDAPHIEEAATRARLERPELIWTSFVLRRKPAQARQEAA